MLEAGNHYAVLEVRGSSLRASPAAPEARDALLAWQATRAAALCGLRADHTFILAELGHIHIHCYGLYVFMEYVTTQVLLIKSRILVGVGNRWPRCRSRGNQGGLAHQCCNLTLCGLQCSPAGGTGGPGCRPLGDQGGLARQEPPDAPGQGRPAQHRRQRGRQRRQERAVTRLYALF